MWLASLGGKGRCLRRIFEGLDLLPKLGKSGWNRQPEGHPAGLAKRRCAPAGEAVA